MIGNIHILTMEFGFCKLTRYFIPLLFVTQIHAELFSATSQLEPLLETHKEIITNLQDYLRRAQEKLAYLNAYLKYFKQEHESAMEDVEGYLGNPTNAFRLIKRLKVQYDSIEKTVTKRIDYKKNTKALYPTREDLAGAARALSQLQDVYQLSAADLANGMLSGITSAQMSAADCYEIAVILYNDKDYNKSISWMTEAINKYNPENKDVYSFALVDMVARVIESYVSLDDYESAVLWTTKIGPSDHELLLNRVADSLRHKYHEEESFEGLNSGNSYGVKVKVIEKESQNKEIMNAYGSLCRTDTGLPAHITKRLKCFLLTEIHPVLRLAPVKTEQLYIQPDILMFHEVMNEAEMQHIKDMAKPRLQSTIARYQETKSLKKEQIQISKMAELLDNDSIVMEAVSCRISHFTGLNQLTDKFQVLNYGIGGYYLPDNKNDSSKINKTAAVLFYLSDVEAGGATVFLHLGLKVKPVKGSAILWWQRHQSKKEQVTLRPAACPILHGSKWEMVKWIDQPGEERVQSCKI